MARTDPRPHYRYVVYEAGTDPRGKQVHHRNGDKTDNRLENLEVISNGDHQREHHLRPGMTVTNQYGTFEIAGDSKTCRWCGERKPVSAFSLSHGRPVSYCKPCIVYRTREYQRGRKPVRLGAAVGAAVLFLACLVGVATAADLDDLAQCESGGDPNYEDGTFSGAYNFLPSTWRSLGLDGRPSDHSYEEQKAAAAALIRRSGQASQFPGCTAKLGTVSLDGAGSSNASAPSVAPPPAKPRDVAPSTPAKPVSGQGVSVTG